MGPMWRCRQGQRDHDDTSAHRGYSTEDGRFGRCFGGRLRWPIETAFETSNDGLGMDHNEVRSRLSQRLLASGDHLGLAETRAKKR